MFKRIGFGSGSPDSGGWDSDYAYAVAWKCAWWAQGPEARREIAQESVCQAWLQFATVRERMPRATARQCVAQAVRLAVREAARYSPDRSRFACARPQGYVDAMDRRTDRTAIDNLYLGKRFEKRAGATIEQMLSGCPGLWRQVAMMIIGGVPRKKIQLSLRIGVRTYDNVLARLRQTFRIRGHWPLDESDDSGTE